MSTSVYTSWLEYQAARNVNTCVPLRMENDQMTRFGLAARDLEEAIAETWPGFKDLNSLARENIIDALFLRRQAVAEALDYGGKEMADEVL